MERAFEFLNGWADRVFVVSLERAVERRARMRERLAGLRYEFFPAVDKAALDRARLVREGTYDERRTRRAYRHRVDMPLGHIGCSLSHRAIYEEALRQGWRRVVVFEDDLVALPDGIAALPAALSQLPPDWELCYLGYWKNQVVSGSARLRQAIYVALAPLGLVRWRPREALRLLPRPYSANLRRAGRHMCTHAYAFTPAAARRLVAAQTPVAYRSDQLIASLVLGGKLNAFVAHPMAFDQVKLAGSAVESGEPASYIAE